MFSTLKTRLLLGAYIFIVLSIPVGAYLVSQNQTIKSSAKEQKSSKPAVKSTPKPSTSPAKELLDDSLSSVSQEGSLLSSPSPSPSPTIATSYGPTLAFKAILEGSPENNQATRMFVGILEGSLTTNPKFLLSFTVDLPASGEYSNISLAGLNPGTRYSALLKSTSQIATSSAFIMAPAVSNLNSGNPLNLISGDLNDDNIVNSADYSIAQKALGSTPNSSNWNAIADLNKDSSVNIFDLAIISKNIGQIGASGAWVSPIPKNATSSGNLTTPIGSPENSPPSGGTGYWIWVPGY